MDLSFCFSCFCFICYSILLFLVLVKGIISSTFFDTLLFESSKKEFYYHLLPSGVGDMNMNMMMMQNLIERLRPLVGLNGWDYCVYWKLSEDQRFVEWLGCCCGGTDQNNNVGEDIHISPCRDTMFPHPRTNHCYLLSQLPTSISMDSGIHAQTLLTNQPNWVNYSSGLDPNMLQETIGTQVLIPVAGALVELFVTKQVPEDHQVIDFVTAQCIVLVDQEAAAANNNSISFNMQPNHNNNLVLEDDNEMNNNNNNHFVLHHQPPPISASDTSPNDLCNSPLNFMHHFSYNNNRTMKNSKNNDDDDNHNNAASAAAFSEGTFLHENQNNNNHPMKPSSAMEEEEEEEEEEQQEMMMDTKENHKKNEGGVGVGRSDSMSDCSEQNEEEEETKYRRRNGKGSQSKNLFAERKRRKKLNDRLYHLRSLVPRISKLDRASILGDAIEFVKDLQKQVKDLQDELEDNNSSVITAADSVNQFLDHNHHLEASYVIPKQKQEAAVDGRAVTMDNKHTQQMEPQVEVAVIDGKEYFVKVFCEHRAGGFVKLMEALNTLGMDVVHATVTSHKGLVSNVFKVEKKDSDMVEAEDVRDSLLELTRSPSCSRGVWTNNNNNNNNNATLENNGHHNHNHNQNHQMGAYHPHPFHT